MTLMVEWPMLPCAPDHLDACCYCAKVHAFANSSSQVAADACAFAATNGASLESRTRIRLYRHSKKDFVYFVIQTLIIGGNRLSMALFPPPPSRRSLRFLEKRRDSFLFLGRAGRFRVFIFGGKKGFRHVDMHGTVVACSKRVIVADMLNAADEAT